MVYLKYIGGGSYLPDVPARDLTKEEAEYHGVGRLLDSHLYELIEQKEEESDTQYGSAKKRGKQ